jgi:hypothetical protein
MPSSGMLRCMAFVRTDVSEERSCSIIRVTIISELEKTVTVSIYQLLLRRNTHIEFLRSMSQLLVTGNVVLSSLILFPMMRMPYVPPKRRFLQEPQGVTSQKAALFN